MVINMNKQIKEWKDLKGINMEFITEFVKNKGNKDMLWLVSLMEEEIKDDKRKTGKRKRTFQEIKSEFSKKYFPNLIQEKEEKPMEKALASLKAALEE